LKAADVEGSGERKGAGEQPRWLFFSKPRLQDDKKRG